MFLDQVFTNQIAEGLRAIGIPSPLDAPVELLEQVGIDGDADAAEAFRDRFVWHIFATIQDMTRAVLVVAAACSAGFGMQQAKAPAWAAGAKVMASPVGSKPNATAFGTPVFFAGQPGEADVAEYAKLGGKKVINLRLLSEMQGVGFDEAAVAKNAGLMWSLFRGTEQAWRPTTLWPRVRRPA